MYGCGCILLRLDVEAHKLKSAYHVGGRYGFPLVLHNFHAGFGDSEVVKSRFLATKSGERGDCASQSTQLVGEVHDLNLSFPDPSCALSNAARASFNAAL